MSQSTDRGYGLSIAVQAIDIVSSLGPDFVSNLRQLKREQSSFASHETVLVADDPYGGDLRPATVARVADAIVPVEAEGLTRMTALMQPVLERLWRRQPPVDLHVLATPISENEVPAIGSRCGDSFRYFHAVRGAKSLDPMKSAFEALQTGRARRAAVTCTDSLVDGPLLHELMMHEKLLDAANPEGIIAGEAAGSVIFSRSSEQDAGTTFLFVDGWGESTQGEDEDVGAALTRAVSAALSFVENADVGALCCDYNGQTWRADELAMVEARLLDTNEDLLWEYPVLVAGDCGWGSLPLIFVQACATFLREEGCPTRIIATICEENGYRGAILLRRGNIQKQHMRRILRSEQSIRGTRWAQQ